MRVFDICTSTTIEYMTAHEYVTNIIPIVFIHSGFFPYLSPKQSLKHSAVSIIYLFIIIVFVFLSVRLLSVLRGHSVFSSPP